MKKQLFLLSLSLLVAGQFVQADNCKTDCKTSCKTSCSKKTDCKKTCVPDHGHTYRRVENHYQAATPVMVSMSETNYKRNLHDDDKKGAFQMAVFGGRSTRPSEAACYFLPYGQTKLNFDGEVKAKTYAQVLAVTTATGAASLATSGEISGTGAAYIDPATFQYDVNKDRSIVRPWNFGITFAALFEPTGAAKDGDRIGTGLLTEPSFKSSISPELRYSHVGIGFGLRYHFSEEKEGFFGSLTTAVQHVRSNICLNEDVSANKVDLDENYPEPLPDGGAGQPGNTTSTTSGVQGSVASSYINASTGTGFPVEANVDNPANVTPPANVAEAFDQSAWNYGKIGCEQKTTRLADMELSLGYQWLCGDCAANSAYLGLVIPTGNRVCAEYVAPAVVGNGFHAGIMAGSSTELLLTENEDRQLWYRLDTNGRYLFRNTQKRSFDLHGNEWSRYMMVWENKEAYEAAVTEANGLLQNLTGQRAYTPGINVFTHDMYVKPRYQGRINSAFYFRGDCFRGELGWNVFARQKECVEFACDWNQNPAFASPNYGAGVGLNNHRTIYNDAQTSEFNAIDPIGSSARIDQTNQSYVVTLANAALSADCYDDFAITTDDVNFNSAATPGVITHTPYATLGWTWDCDYHPQVSVGASYEFSASNTALNQWMVWGKFELAF